MYLKNFDHAFNAEHVMWFCAQTRRTLVERCGLRIESFTFVDDLAPDTSQELPYRLFSNLWFGTLRLFPLRYQNTMVAVCAASEKQELAKSAVRGTLPSAVPDIELSTHPSHAQLD